jgi:hypothetical protein
MKRSLKHTRQGAVFDDAACVHHDDAVGKSHKQGWAVRNENQGRSQLSPHSPKSVQDFRL